MKKSQLKQILKPLIKECIKEVVFEEGFLSGIITEVVKGVSASDSLVVESNKEDEEIAIKAYEREKNIKAKQALNEHRKRMLEAVNKDAYNGMDVFEGTKPLSSAGGQGQDYGAMSGRDSADAGIDISGLMDKRGAWKALMGK